MVCVVGSLAGGCGWFLGGVGVAGSVVGGASRVGGGDGSTQLMIRW